MPASVVAALDWAQARVGVREQPPGSRRGPEIDEWQLACGLVGHAWCGAFAAAALRAGGLEPPAAIVWTPHLLDWARAGERGFSLATWAERAAGDLVLFRFGDEREVDHVGLLDLDLRHTIEGNTTVDGRGHEAAGGVVARRDRGGDRVVALARPAWPPWP
ncbi:MAG: hypothetical protein R3C15_20185 [Thermoleophilia bacterium]